jgi:hypothetical protein
LLTEPVTLSFEILLVAHCKNARDVDRLAKRAKVFDLGRFAMLPSDAGRGGHVLKRLSLEEETRVKTYHGPGVAQGACADCGCSQIHL